ncbi:MAG: trigger factor, partial [Salaquimonas sp.]
MQVTETLNKGLERELKVVVPKEDLAGKLNARLEDMKGKVKIDGFRQGKVPAAHIKKLYGKQIMAEIVNETINTRSGDVLKERKEKAAQQPEISMTEDEKEAEAILAGLADFEFKISYEVMPEITVPDLAKLKIERPVVDVSDAEVDEQVMKVAENARTYEEKKGKAADGDRVIMDYLGKLDGTPFDGGKDEDAQLVVGSNRFIPGFEEQLIGFKAGDEKTIKVTFPTEYPAANLAGKDVEFDVKVKKVEKPVKLEINDELAKQLGVESAEKLREAIKSQ